MILEEPAAPEQGLTLEELATAQETLVHAGIDVQALKERLRREPDYLANVLAEMVEELAEEVGLEAAATLVESAEQEMERIN